MPGHKDIQGSRYMSSRENHEWMIAIIVGGERLNGELKVHLANQWNITMKTAAVPRIQQPHAHDI
jgi:hypothetical protein